MAWCGLNRLSGILMPSISTPSDVYLLTRCSFGKVINTSPFSSTHKPFGGRFQLPFLSVYILNIQFMYNRLPTIAYVYGLGVHTWSQIPGFVQLWNWNRVKFVRGNWQHISQVHVLHISRYRWCYSTQWRRWFCRIQLIRILWVSHISGKRSSIEYLDHLVDQ